MDLNWLLFLPYVYLDLRFNFARTFGGNTNKKCWKSLVEVLDSTYLVIWNVQQQMSIWLSLKKKALDISTPNKKINKKKIHYPHSFQDNIDV